MAQVFDPLDLNQDGVVNYKDDELAGVRAAQERLRLAKEAAATSGQEDFKPQTEVSDLQTIGKTRRDNEARVIEAVPDEEEAADPTTFGPIDLSTLDRAEKNVNDRFQEALGEDVILERKLHQSSDKLNNGI